VQRGYEFAFLFDQDSSLCDLYVSRMLHAFQEVSALTSSPVAALGPRIINPQTRRQTPFKLFNRLILRSDRHFQQSRHYFQADFLITSGTLLLLSNLIDIGNMKASYFIDNVDLEWCFRARSLGYELAGTDQAVLYHAIGERSSSPLVRRGLIAQHNPSRTYYSSRNRMHLYRASYSPWGWKLRDCVRFFLKASWLLIVSAQRRQYWKNISAGIRDARMLK
jgi:rhamnosyltransferase